MTLQFVDKTSLPAFMDKLQVQTLTIWKLRAVYNVISFFSPARGRPPRPPTVSWAVRCVLTLDHLPVSPMSNANHTGRQRGANPAISELLSHSFTSPHRLHCGREHRNPHKCAITVTVIVMCHIAAASTLHYITASNFSMNTSMRQRLWISLCPAITQPVYQTAESLKGLTDLSWCVRQQQRGCTLWLSRRVMFKVHRDSSV